MFFNVGIRKSKIPYMLALLGALQVPILVRTCLWTPAACSVACLCASRCLAAWRVPGGWLRGGGVGKVERWLCFSYRRVLEAFSLGQVLAAPSGLGRCSQPGSGCPWRWFLLFLPLFENA